MVQCATGAGEGADGVRPATLRPRKPLPKERLPRAQRDQVKDLHCHYNGTDLAVQERAGNLLFTTNAVQW